MSKGVKIILMIAGICIAAGTVILGAAWLMAGRDYRNFVDTGKDSYEEQHFSSNGRVVNSIKIESMSGSVHFDESEDSDIHVSYKQNDEYGYSVNLSNSGELTVSYLDMRPWYRHIFYFGFFMDDSVTVSLPKSFDGDLYIKSISGDITSPEAALNGDLTMISTSGYIDCFVSKAQSAVFQSTSGDIKLNSPLSVSETVKLTSTSGEITADSIDGREISAKTVSGDIEIHEAKADTFSASSTSGQIALDVLDVQSASFKTVSGDIDFAGNIYDLEIHTTSGEVGGHLSGKLEDYTISTKTTSGSCNLPDISLGSKKINISTVSGDIDVNFNS